MNDKTTQQNTQELQKYFASILRKKSKGEANGEAIDSSIIRFFTRKELVAILNQKFDGKLPKEVNLIELENEDLLQLIEDELIILAYLVPKWIQAEMDVPISNANSTEEKPKVPPIASSPYTSSTSKDKGGSKPSDKKKGKEDSNAN